MSLKLDRLSAKYMNEVEEFQCEQVYEPFETFIKSEAFRYNYNGDGNTYVLWSTKLKRIVAYYTLKCTAITMKHTSEDNDNLFAIPSIELSRFAVDYRNTNKGLGTSILLNYILPQIYYIRKLTAVKAILVFALDDERTKHVYEKVGFEKMSEELQATIEFDNEECISMIIGLKDNDEIFKEIEKNSIGMKDIEKVLMDIPKI